MSENNHIVVCVRAYESRSDSMCGCGGGMAERWDRVRLRLGRDGSLNDT